MATTFEAKLTESTEAQRLADRLRGDLDLLRGAPLKVMDLLVGLHKRVLQAEVNGQGRLTPAGLQEQIDGLRNKALQTIDGLEQQCQVAKERIEQVLGEAERRQVGDVQSAILQELREQRAWARLKPILDNLEPAAALLRIRDLVQQASSNGDDVVLSVLESELPWYVESRGAAGAAPQILAAITEARLPHLPPVVRKAISTRKELAEGWPRLAACFEQARRDASGGSLTVVLPGWSPSESVTP